MSVEFVMGRDDKGPWIGRMRDDVYGMKWRKTLSLEQARGISNILISNALVKGPLTFCGPQCYIVTNKVARQVVKRLRRAQ